MTKIVSQINEGTFSKEIIYDLFKISGVDAGSRSSTFVGKKNNGCFQKVVKEYVR